MPETLPGFKEREVPVTSASKVVRAAQESNARATASPLGARELHLVDGAAAPLSRFPSAEVIDRRPYDKRSKRILDVCGAIFFGILFSPLIVGLIIIIRLDGKPAVFRHRRLGRNGRVFCCLKFRTMVPNAESVLRGLLRAHPELRDEWTENHKLRNDPRITPIGRFLRATSLDELPQLWNVLIGDMSLVGPRPIVRAELLRYGRSGATYLSVRPGLTGLWQVMGRSDTTYRRRVAMDKYYVSHQKLLMDVYILILTAGVVFKRVGAY
jgi:Undecaprenyl-phosphate galactose phosphotransferase WbaP